MIVLVDLDNTLVDRDRAFRTWAHHFVSEISAEPGDLDFGVALETAVRHGGHGPAWMIGDHPVADIAGAEHCGLLTGWVSHHRVWTAGEPADIAHPLTVDLLGRMRP